MSCIAIQVLYLTFYVLSPQIDSKCLRTWCVCVCTCECASWDFPQLLATYSVHNRGLEIHEERRKRGKGDGKRRWESEPLNNTRMGKAGGPGITDHITKSPVTKISIGKRRGRLREVDRSYTAYALWKKKISDTVEKRKIRSFERGWTKHEI